MMHKLKAFLQNAIDYNKFPGAHYAYVTKNKIITDFVGYKQIYPTKEFLKGDEVYDIASLTKVISTTTLIMKLIELGKLSLETKIQTLLERYKHPNTTIKDLLSHQSGLPADEP